MPRKIAARRQFVHAAVPNGIRRMRGMVTGSLAKIRELLGAGTRLAHLEQELDALRSKLEVDDTIVNEFHEARDGYAYQVVYELDSPLVSVCIGTFNRAELLVKRSISSALAQTYENIEVLVIGDCCTDETEDLVMGLDDPRVKFVNLSERGKYPKDPTQRWMVAGTVPFNKALALARGAFITHLDDDDEYTPDRIATLIQTIQADRSDLVHHAFLSEANQGRWRLNPGSPFRRGFVTTSSILYHNWFARIPWDINAYKLHEPGDWNRLRKLRYLGARLSFVRTPLLRHYKERSQRH